MKQNKLKNISEMFCPQCGGRVELDSPEVKFCRFCGLPLDESRDAVRGFTELKRQALKFSNWGYVLLQIMFIVVYLILIPSSLPVWGSIILLLVFALSNGFFIAGNLAFEKPEKYLKETRAERIETRTNQTKRNLNERNERSASSITEGTTRKFFKSAVSE